MEIMKDSQGNIINIGDELRSIQGGPAAIKVINICAGIGTFEWLTDGIRFRATQMSIQNSKWIKCDEINNHFSDDRRKERK